MSVEFSQLLKELDAKLNEFIKRKLELGVELSNINRLIVSENYSSKDKDRDIRNNYDELRNVDNKIAFIERYKRVTLLPANSSELNNISDLKRILSKLQ